VKKSLSKAYEDAVDIMKPRLPDEQYDIYKYFEDANGNIFILYKNYGNA